MSTTHEMLLHQLVGVCCPGLTLSPVSDGAPLLLKGRARKKRVHYLFTRALTLWTTKYTEYAFAFYVPELTFDTLAQCYTDAFETGTTHSAHTAKRSRIHLTIVILCDSAQADAFEAATRFNGYLASKTMCLNYALAVVNRSTGEVACNRRARKFRSVLLAQLAGN